MQGISVKPYKCQSINNYYNFPLLDMIGIFSNQYHVKFSKFANIIILQPIL